MSSSEETIDLTSRIQNLKALDKLARDYKEEKKQREEKKEEPEYEDIREHLRIRDITDQFNDILYKIDENLLPESIDKINENVFVFLDIVKQALQKYKKLKNQVRFIRNALIDKKLIKRRNKKIQKDNIKKVLTEDLPNLLIDLSMYFIEQNDILESKNYIVTILADIYIVSFGEDEEGKPTNEIADYKKATEGPIVIKISSPFKPNTELFNNAVRNKLTDGDATKQNASDSTYREFILYPIGKDIEQIKGKTINELPIEQFTFKVEKITLEEYIANLRIREFSHPILQRFGADEWNENPGQCAADYLYAKYGNNHVTRDKINKLLNANEQGVKYLDFCKAMDELNLNYIIVGPDHKIMDRKQNDKHHNKPTAILYINNSHVYPIESETLRQHINKLSIGDYAIDTYISSNQINYNKVSIEKDLTKLVIENYKSKKVLPDKITVKSNKIIAAQYLEVSYINATDDINAVKQFITQVNNCVKQQIEFKNQSLQSVAKEALKYLGFKIPYDQYNQQVEKELFADSLLKPYCHSISTDVTLQAADISRCHKQILTNLNYKYGFPIFTIYDEIKQYNGENLKTGFYYLKHQITLYNFLIINSTWLDANLIDYLLDRGLIHKTDISHKLESTYSVPTEAFISLNTIINKTDLSNDFKKSILNNLAGLFGSVNNNTQTGFITNDVALVNCQAGLNKHIVQLTAEFSNDKMGGLFLITEDKQTQKKHNRAIWYSIICGEYIALSMLIERIQPKKIYAIRTDSLYYEGGEDYRGEYKYKELSICIRQEIIRNIKADVLPVEYNQPLNIPNYNWNILNIDEAIQTNQGFMIDALAGFGKSYVTINKILVNLTDYVIAGISHKSLIQYKTLGFNVSTISALLDYQFSGLSSLAKKYKWIVIDEYSMLSTTHISQLYKLKKLGVRIILIGDHNQILAIENFPKRHIDHLCIKEITDFNFVKLQYHPNSRYTEETKEQLDNFLQTGILPTLKKPNKPIEHYFNIAYHIKKCDEINNSIKNPTRYICNKLTEIGEVTIYNNELFNKIGDNCHSLDRDLVLPFTECVKVLSLAHCITAHKAQCMTILTDVLIHEADQMSKEQLYVCLSRTKSISNCYTVDNTRKQFNPTNTSYNTIPVNNYYEKTGYIIIVDNKISHSLDKPEANFIEVQYKHITELINQEYETVLSYVKKGVKVQSRLYEKALAELQPIIPKDLSKPSNRIETDKQIIICYYLNGTRLKKKFIKDKYKDVEYAIKTFLENL